MKLFLIILFSLSVNLVFAQKILLKGEVVNRLTNEPVAAASIIASDSSVITDAEGKFSLLVREGEYLLISAVGFVTLNVQPTHKAFAMIYLHPTGKELGEVVVTGTMKSVLKTASPVPVEVYTPQFFRKNPTPTIFDALQLVNGVRPQLNCNVCNTGDIHINGLEGPYTMVLIDGMPIVSSLASVYGLSGIPNSLVERIEVVKGPASSLYGSEAIGGLINVITKNPSKAPLFSLDVSNTTWREWQVDAGLKYKLGDKISSLLGVNYFNYTHPFDKNNDNFTDVTLQDRISVFNKYSFRRGNNRVANIIWRYVYEDRWGGEMQWNKNFRGGDSLYGESIYTSRLELIGNYQLPISEKLMFSYSYNSHSQRSVYGIVPFNALQKVAFAQLTWDKTVGHHDLLGGAVFRYTRYDDNTTATFDTVTKMNRATRTPLPGFLMQDEIHVNDQQKLLLGLRWDYHPVHGLIFTPRMAWKFSFTDNDIVRLNAGTGFRVVNLFTEDHAALTGAREVIVRGELKPERSFNINLNYVKKIYTAVYWLNMDASAWYTYFTNRILADYETNPNQIIYDNLKGYSVSKGISINTEFGFTHSLRGHLGATLMDVSILSKTADGKKIHSRQLLTERWTGVWSLSYYLRSIGLTVDYTGNIYGPMRLPLLSALDPRRPQSPAWSLQNIQFSKKINKSWEMYAGIKNIWNWKPGRHNPFLIARANDPFDKQVEFNNNGQVVATAGNPYALTFDPNYVYGPNQGRRGFIGVRLVLSAK